MQLILAKLAKDAFFVRPVKLMEGTFAVEEAEGASSSSSSQTTTAADRFTVEEADVGAVLQQILEDSSSSFVAANTAVAAGVSLPLRSRVIMAVRSGEDSHANTTRDNAVEADGNESEIDVAVLADYVALLKTLYTTATATNKITARTADGAKGLLFADGANEKKQKKDATATDSPVFNRFLSLCAVLRRLLIGASSAREEQDISRFLAPTAAPAAASAFSSGFTFGSPAPSSPAAALFTNPFFDNTFAVAKAAIAAGLGVSSLGAGAPAAALPLSPWVLPALLPPASAAIGGGSSAGSPSKKSGRSPSPPSGKNSPSSAAAVAFTAAPRQSRNASMAVLEGVYIPLLACYLLECDGDFCFAEDDEEAMMGFGADGEGGLASFLEGVDDLLGAKPVISRSTSLAGGPTA